MRSRAILPSRWAVQIFAVLAVLAVAALLAGLPSRSVGLATGAVLAVAVVYALADLWYSLRLWRNAPLRLERRLPGAFSLGVPTEITLTLFNEGRRAWRFDVFDEVDPQFTFQGLPQTIALSAQAHVVVRYTAAACMRGMAVFGPTQIRWRTRSGCFQVRQRLGEAASLRVYPNFAAMARYAWLAGNQRLAQIGIKSYQQRGQGTDFRQLSDYRTGDSLHRIDWKATLRQQRPIVREYQDDRDQCVLFLLDCGRRMRADETDAAFDSAASPNDAPVGGSHFDEALNALMLLSYVALKDGDEVGAMTFGTAPGEQRNFAPRKGVATLNALMNRLHDIQPGLTHSDYMFAARQVMSVQRRRALVIVLTNFRDEDAAELRPAVGLLRSHHLVLVASLRERVIGRIAAGPLRREQDAVDVAAAHLFEQTRRDTFAHVVGNDPLSVDVEPAQLAIALVNRYHAVKRAGLL